MGIPKSNEKLQTKIIIDSWNTYICVSSIWTPETEARWAITKIDATWNTTYPLDDITQKVVYSFKFLISEVLNLRYGYKYTLPPLWIPQNIQWVDFYENDWLFYLNSTNTPSITWDIVDWADSYEVSIDNWVTIFEALINSFNISDLWLDTDNTYEIKVRAIRWEESSDFSLWFTFIRDTEAPTWLTLTSASPTLQWTTYIWLTATVSENLNSSMIWQTDSTLKLWTYIITWISSNTITFSYTSPTWLVWTPTNRVDKITFNCIDLAWNNSSLFISTLPLS